MIRAEIEGISGACGSLCWGSGGGWGRHEPARGRGGSVFPVRMNGVLNDGEVSLNHDREIERPLPGKGGEISVAALHGPAQPETTSVSIPCSQGRPSDSCS